MFFLLLIIKITISSLVIGLKMSYFLLIRLPSCYRTVCVFCNFFHFVDKHKLSSHFQDLDVENKQALKDLINVLSSLVYLGYDLCCYESKSIHGTLQKCNWYSHKNCNFLACDWFKNVLFSTNSLAKLLSDSLLLDILLLDSLLSDSFISQSHSKM